MFRESGPLQWNVDTAGPLLSALQHRERVHLCMLLRIEPPVGNTRGPVYTESLLRTLHRMIDRRRPLSLLLTGDKEGVGLAVVCPDELRVAFLQELQDAYGVRSNT